MMTRNLVFGVILLALLNHRAIFCHAAQVETTISNSTADYFVISTSNKDNTITCPASKGCYIHCTGEQNCWGLNIASSESGPPTWLYLECSGEDTWVCQGLSISVSPTQSAEIICFAHRACEDAQFTLSTTRAVNIRCTNKWSCWDFHVDASESNELLLSCVGNRACQHANIYPPHHQQYAFAMTCSDDAYSCRGAKVHVPSSSSSSSSQSVDNYMQLVCPTNNKKGDTCSLVFHCNPTKRVTKMEWNSATLRYECADTVCCPWSNPNNMRRPEKHNMNQATVAIAVCFVLLAAYYTFGLGHGRAQHDHGANDRPAPPIGNDCNDDNAAAVIADGDADEKEQKNEDAILAAHSQPGMQMNYRENLSRRASALNVAHYAQWNSDEVVDWIVALNYRAYQRYEHALRHEFRRHEVDGHTLRVLKESDFERVVTKLLHRREIYEQIQTLVRGDFVPHDRHDEPQIEGEFQGPGYVQNNQPRVAKVTHFQ